MYNHMVWRDLPQCECCDVWKNAFQNIILLGLCSEQICQCAINITVMNCEWTD